MVCVCERDREKFAGLKKTHCSQALEFSYDKLLINSETLFNDFMRMNFSFSAIQETDDVSVHMGICVCAYVCVCVKGKLDFYTWQSVYRDDMRFHTQWTGMNSPCGNMLMDRCSLCVGVGMSVHVQTSEICSINITSLDCQQFSDHVLIQRFEALLVIPFHLQSLVI